MQGPQMKQMNVDMNSLKGKLGSSGSSSAPSGPLLPSQGVFRQKPWLPWWLVPVAIAIAALAVLLYMLLPRNVVVPDLVGKKSTFEAEETLTEAKLKLAGTTKEKVDPKAPAGSIVGQTPKAGEKAEEDEEVTVLIAVGDGKISVPNVTGMTLTDAEGALRDKKLSLGQSSPQPPDPKGKIESQIPAADEIVPEGKPVDVFFADPNGKKGGDAKEEGRRCRRWRRRRWRRRRRRRRWRRGPRRPGDRRRAARGLRPEARRRRPGARAGAPVRRLQARHAVRDRAARRHQGQGGRQGQAAGLGRRPEGGVRQRGEHQAHQRRHRRPVPGHRQGPAARRRTRPGAPTAPASRTWAAGGSSSRT